MRTEKIPLPDKVFLTSKIYFLLVENFPQTFFVGGAVRDALLGRKIIDIDIATSATPPEVAVLLSKNKINFDDSYSQFGVIVAEQGSESVEIATFRKETYGSSRYPKIKYTANAKEDAPRRDFTINALYLQVKTNKILDFFGGRKDIKNRMIKFIGNPKKRIAEDPLRIARALRFCIMLDFKLEKQTKKQIKNNFNLIKSLTKSKLEKEILKLHAERDRALREKNIFILKKVINRPETLDKYFK